MNENQIITDEEEVALEKIKELLYRYEQPHWNWAICCVEQNFLSGDSLKEVITGSASTWQDAYIEALEKTRTIEKAENRNPFLYAVINLSPGSLPFMWITAGEVKENSQMFLKKLGLGKDMEKIAAIKAKNPDDIGEEDALEMLNSATEIFEYVEQAIEEKIDDSR